MPFLTMKLLYILEEALLTDTPFLRLSVILQFSTWEVLEDSILTPFPELLKILQSVISAFPPENSQIPSPEFSKILHVEMLKTPEVQTMPASVFLLISHAATSVPDNAPSKYIPYSLFAKIKSPLSVSSLAFAEIPLLPLPEILFLSMETFEELIIAIPFPSAFSSRFSVRVAVELSIRILLTPDAFTSLLTIFSIEISFTYIPISPEPVTVFPLSVTESVVSK